jgi:DNA end-binding protein Ku
VHDREVGPDEIVKGWEVTKGQFVVVEDADLEALERVDESRAIEITRFVPLEQVDPVYFDRTYFLTPAPAPAARRPYVLLLAAMRETGMGGIGRMVIRGKEYQCLIRPKGDALALETLFLAEDVHSQAEIEEAVADADVRDQELDLARQVIASLADEFDPAALESRYRRDLRALLEAKLEGVEPAKPEPVAEAPVVDLLEALRASVAQASKKKPKAAAGDAAKKAKSSGSGSKTRAATRKSS